MIIKIIIITIFIIDIIIIEGYNQFELEMTNTKDEEAVDKVVEAVRDLSIKFNIAKTLREIGISYEMIPTLAKQAINDACTPGNPREVTVEDLIDIYEAAY